MITVSDIIFVLSGGSSNSDPNKSLGGDPSSHIITGTINNLFDNVEEEESRGGNIDYRCFYVFNNSNTDFFYYAEAYIVSQITLGSTVQVGTYSSTDVQRMTFTGSITGGTITLSYEGENTAAIAWDSDPDTFADNILAGLNDLSLLSGVDVPNPPGVIDDVMFIDLHFLGEDDKRNHDLIVVESNDLTGGPDVDIIKVKEGGPINTIASELDYDIIRPSGVTFSTPSSGSPLELGTLRPGDGVPIWVKRITDESTEALPRDGFTFLVKGTPFEL